MIKNTAPTGLDSFDLKILDVLSRNGRITVTDLARAIGLSKTPCQARMKRLEREGYITGYRAILNPVKLRREHVSFVQVTLSDTRAAALEAFNKAILNVPEVEQCHMIAGDFDYLLKVRTNSMEDYRRVMGEELSGLPHLANTSTFVCMEAVREGQM